MITNLKLKNFKLFKEITDIPLANINLLTGINGKGKSTVLQSFLLIKQSPEFNRTTDKIIFNGSYLQLGNIKDVKNIKSSQNEAIEFNFHYSYSEKEFELIYKFNTIEDYSLDAQIESIKIDNVRNLSDLLIYKKDSTIHVKKQNNEVNFPFLFDLFVKGENIDNDIRSIEQLINLSKIHYISADRIGPKVYYSKHSLNEFYSVGALGQNTINVLWHKKDDRVYENLCENNKLPRTVLTQLEYWLEKIFDGARITLVEIKETNLLSFKISSDNSTDYYIPTNVGFGYSYILPILVSGLIAKDNEILIVENPEAHIHPFAQSRLSDFLTKVSLNGVQILIESHSEHILNGLRISVKDKFIKPENLNVLYFDKKGDKLFEKINVDIEGGINNWPSNFFDQATKDLNHLFDI